MKESLLGNQLDPLREMLSQYTFILEGYREANGVGIAGLVCETMPPEVCAALGLVPSRIPSFVRGYPCCRSCQGGDSVPAGPYDVVLAPAGCNGEATYDTAGPLVVPFPIPRGYGEEHAIALDGAIAAFCASQGIDRSRLTAEALHESTEEYNFLRRLVRGIGAVRRKNPELLSQADCMTILEAAAVFPPILVVEHLIHLQRLMQERSGDGEHPGIPAFVYASFVDPATLLDAIEDLGFIIAEDDLCNGRRSFDMSINADSPALYAEILDAYSYRPLCACKRPAQERFDLLYAQLRQHDIETVIFIEDWCCPAKRRDIDFLRVRLMRSGIDPVVVTSGDALVKMGVYKEKAG